MSSQSTRTASWKYLFIWILVVLANGCHSKSQSEAETEAEREQNQKLLAEVNGEGITLGRFQAAVDGQPAFLSEENQGQASAMSSFRSMLSFVLLVDEAKRQGLDKDPGVLIETRRALGQALLEEVGARVSGRNFSARSARMRSQSTVVSEPSKRSSWRFSRPGQLSARTY